MIVRELLTVFGVKYDAKAAKTATASIDMLARKAGALAAILLSPESGLIGSPELGLDGAVKAHALLNHRISPGHQVLIKSAHINQHCRIERTIYSGNLADEGWFVELEARGL